MSLGDAGQKSASRKSRFGILARSFGMEDLIHAGTLDRQLANRLEDYVLKRKNLLVSVGTGSGKTTLTGLLARFIPEVRPHRSHRGHRRASTHAGKPRPIRSTTRSEWHAGSLHP